MRSGEKNGKHNRRLLLRHGSKLICFSSPIESVIIDSAVYFGHIFTCCSTVAVKKRDATRELKKRYKNKCAEASGGFSRNFNYEMD